jgi:protein farnesyltransferase subunit beta
MELRPTPIDGFPTPTSKTQAETEAVLIKHIPDPTSTSTPPALLKNAHMQFLVRNLIQGFPTRYISQDASQPWLIFWTVQAFSVLQVGLDPGNKQR